ncbi:GNAT family N-acetyltransferase [Pseudohalocynthiibacter sp. F2068]|jgi:RimJ/RimL family protein N-acetyltransferase|uniref:GNAT family N-acetyltransferase n=1 Tax=Pseudohalocynthiibacter sp. F2068 TaxID=2926418 RepID=UPI001FF0EA3E|nr:GNAT family N-acetyltransferase [Pseudohalocynthiibacter sp. F2068]MCK0100943.1 GNAT family N-acetyltransferase [Pseudohalocynthiibacter sp. F2068]
MENKRTLIFGTPRLEVRAFAPEDWTRLSEIGGNPKVARMMLSLNAPWPEADVKIWMAQNTYQGTLGYLAGIYLPDETLIGFVRIGGTPITCGFAVDPDYQGLGYATEAVHGLLAHAFDTLEAKVIEADHFADNLVSGRVLHKQGFEKIGEGAAKSTARLEPAPNVLYRLTQQQIKAA